MMQRSVASMARFRSLTLVVLSLVVGVWVVSSAQEHPQQQMSPDAVMQAQQPQNVPVTRPEQKKNSHDLSNIFEPQSAQPSSPVFAEQPKEGKNSGFDFYRDPLNSDKPMENPDEIMKKLAADK